MKIKLLKPSRFCRPSFRAVSTVTLKVLGLHCGCYRRHRPLGATIM